MNENNPNKEQSHSEEQTRIDEDLNQESVTDNMRGENNIASSDEKQAAKKKQPAES